MLLENYLFNYFVIKFLVLALFTQLQTENSSGYVVPLKQQQFFIKVQNIVNKFLVNKRNANML